jgi:hypothetical protein
MKTINKSLEPVLTAAFTESLGNYEQRNDGNSLNAVCLHYDAGNQTLVFFDDFERELFSVSLSDTAVVWGGDILQEIKDTAKYVLRGLKDGHVFDSEFVGRPFVVNLIDGHFIVEDKLIFIDDNGPKAGSSLWPDMNRELDEFLRNLMK